MQASLQQSQLIVELREGGYVSLGDPKDLDKQARRGKVLTALSETPERAMVISKKAGASIRDGERLLKWMSKNEQAIRTGKGVKNDPYLYQKCDSRNPPISIDANRIDDPTAKGECDSRNPPSPCANEKAEKVII